MTALLTLLEPALPDAQATDLLRTLLCKGEWSRAAWARWSAHHPLLATLGVQRTDGLAALLPLLRKAGDELGLAFDAEEWTRLRTAAFREELRAKAYAGVLSGVLSTLRAAGVEAMVLGGRPLAAVLHGDPALHHTGPIDLLVREGCEQAGGAALAAQGLRETGGMGAGAWQRRVFLDESGLRVSIGSCVLAHPWYRIEEAAVWAQARAAEPPAVSPALHDELALLCARGIWTGAGRSMLWVLDACLLAGCHDIDWHAFVERVVGGRLALPAAALLAYLRMQLHAPVPEPVERELARAAERSTLLERQLALCAAAAAGDTDVARLWKGVRRSGQWGALARWVMRPDPLVVAWETGRAPARSQAALRLDRPVGFLLRRLRGATPGR